MGGERGDAWDGDDLSTFVESAELSEGQRRRLCLFQEVEHVVRRRVEEVCTGTSLEVTDVAVLVISPAAHRRLLAGEPPTAPRVLVEERRRLHAMLHEMLPPSPAAPFNPYEDLEQPAPARCVRVLILEEESLTLFCYGAFVTVTLGEGVEMPEA